MNLRPSTSICLAPLLAAVDAARAFLIIPQRFAKEHYELSPEGAWQLRLRQPFGLRELAVKKVIQASLTFRRSLQLRVSRNVVIPRLGTEGLLANLLHVLEVTRRTRTDASVYVDWVLRGDEVGFRYGRVNDDVWQMLFEPLGQQSNGPYHTACSELDYALWGTGKDYLSGTVLANHRLAYHHTFSHYIRVANPRVLGEAKKTGDQILAGRYCVGIHRRVDNARVANCHIEGRVPTVEQICTAVLNHIKALGSESWRVYLATDDLLSIAQFKRAFAGRLIFRPCVKRTSANAREVHQDDWGAVSARDAEDALIDTILISKCDVLFHSSSSISTLAGIINPSLKMVRVRAD
jgi:hypothetical protein